MFAGSRIQCPQFLRLLALGLLVLGLLMKPVQAVACEVEDARRALGGEHVPSLIAATDPASTGECCPGERCGQCCVPGTAVLPTLSLADVVPMTSRPLVAWAIEFKATPYPVALRPPIAG